MNFQDDLTWAREQDARDPGQRAEFCFPDLHGKPALYFAGHSLGLMPRKARLYVNEALDDWAARGVEGHFEGPHPWMPYHEELTAPTARLVGARPHEVVVMNTLTVNVHLMMASFYRPTRERYRILVEASPFPSDRYAVHSQARLHGYDPREAVVEVQPGQDARELIDESIALVLLGSPNFLSGEAFDHAGLVRAAHAHGCRIGFDLAHGAGNLALQLHEWGPDFAVWCNYKYLNAGPGGLGGVFVHERHAASDLPRQAGWWGQDKATRFQMGEQFVPIHGAEGWQLSNPPILQLAVLRASMELFDRVGMTELRARGDRLTAYLEWLLLQLRGVELVTPREVHRRGSMLTLRVPGRSAKALAKALHARGAIIDDRPPDILRIAPAPLYNSYEDVQRVCALLREVMGG